MPLEIGLAGTLDTVLRVITNRDRFGTQMSGLAKTVMRLVQKLIDNINIDIEVAIQDDRYSHNRHWVWLS